MLTCHAIPLESLECWFLIRIYRHRTFDSEGRRICCTTTNFIIQPFFERDCVARYIVIKQTQLSNIRSYCSRFVVWTKAIFSVHAKVMSTQKPIPSQLHQHVLGTSCNLILAPLYINIIMVFDWFWLILYTLEEIDIPPNPCETKHLNTQTHCWTCFLLLKTNRKDEGGKAVWTGRSQACGCNDMHLYKAFGVEDWSGDGFDLWKSKKWSVPWDFGVL